MAQTPIAVSVDAITVAPVNLGGSPILQDGNKFTVAGSNVASENGVWDLTSHSIRTQFNRILKKRYATYTPTALVVTNVADLEAQAAIAIF
jgi:hypothetical protein